MLKRKRTASAVETVSETLERLADSRRGLETGIAEVECKIRALEVRVGDGISPFEKLRDMGVALARPGAGEHADTIRMISGGTWVCDACGAESADLDLIGEIGCTRNI